MVEWPAGHTPQAAHAGCCCKSAVCRCAHGKHMSCPLKNSSEAKKMDPKPHFTVQGCGMDAAKANLINALKDFCPPVHFSFSKYDPSVSFSFPNSTDLNFLFDRRFDQPPRNILLFQP